MPIRIECPHCRTINVRTTELYEANGGMVVITCTECQAYFCAEFSLSVSVETYKLSATNE